MCRLGFQPVFADGYSRFGLPQCVCGCMHKYPPCCTNGTFCGIGGIFWGGAARADNRGVMPSVGYERAESPKAPSPGQASGTLGDAFVSVSYALKGQKHKDTAPFPVVAFVSMLLPFQGAIARGGVTQGVALGYVQAGLSARFFADGYSRFGLPQCVWRVYAQIPPCRSNGAFCGIGHLGGMAARV